MKARYGLVICLVAVLALTGVGCKATGGGWFIDELTQHKITFGFNGQSTSDEPVATAKGQFQLVDHDSKMRIHGTFEGTYRDDASEFWGTCSINGTDTDSLYVFCLDDDEVGMGLGDYIEIGIGDWPYLYHYQGALQGGNIKFLK